MTLKKNLPEIIFIFLIVPLAYLIYRQALPGGFVLDDRANLELLANIGAQFNLDELKTFLIQQGVAGPTGRPISLFTFYLQRDSWPSSPENFRHWGILIHIANGLLVYRFVGCLAKNFAPNLNSAWLVFFVTTIWLIHPLNTTTTLYIIQRMTSLSSMFVLLGCLAYLNYRDALESQAPNIKLLLWFIAILIAGICAVFSKESGAILLLYIFCLELTLPSKTLISNKIHKSLRAILFLSISAFFLYLLNSLLFSHWATRDFTPWERVMTQSRILIEYLYKISIPNAKNINLFYDDYTISRGLFDPTSTIVSITLVYSAMIFAYISRNKYPILSFSILWFFLGHALESTSIGLELYFEHRNYLPMLGPIFGLVFLFNSIAKHFRINKIIYAFGVAYIIILSGALFTQAISWANPLTQAITWSKTKPESLRAQEYLAILLANKGYVLDAATVVKASAERHNNELSPWISLARLKCMDDRVTYPNVDLINEKFKTTKNLKYIENSLQELVEATINGHCPQSINDLAFRLVNSLLNNKAATNKVRLYYMRAMLFHHQGASNFAIRDMRQAFFLNQNIEFLIIISNWIAESGDILEACKVVNEAEKYIITSTENKIYKDIIMKKLKQCRVIND